jgi:FkbM family methyltransferase
MAEISAGAINFDMPSAERARFAEAATAQAVAIASDPVPVPIPARPDFNVVVDTKYGPMLCNKHDVYVGGSLIVYGQFSEGESELFRLLLPSGAVVIEAGANIGALTIPIAQHVGESGLVLAYEPQRLAFQLLNANVALNSLTNVITRQAALGASSGTLPVPMLDPTTTNNVGGMDAFGHETGEPVPLRRLDDYGDLQRLDLLKADVEGNEVRVLLGANRLITQHHPHLYLEADRSYLLPQLVGILEQYGYKMWLHRPPLFSEGNYNQRTENIFVRDGKGVVSINILAVHASKTDDLPDLTGVSDLMPLAEYFRMAQQGAE